jgi:hypothetical protein
MLTMSAASRPSRKPIKKLANISPHSPAVSWCLRVPHALSQPKPI